MKFRHLIKELKSELWDICVCRGAATEQHGQLVRLHTAGNSSQHGFKRVNDTCRSFSTVCLTPKSRRSDLKVSSHSVINESAEPAEGLRPSHPLWNNRTWWGKPEQPEETGPSSLGDRTDHLLQVSASRHSTEASRVPAASFAGWPDFPNKTSLICDQLSQIKTSQK